MKNKNGQEKSEKRKTMQRTSPSSFLNNIVLEAMGELFYNLKVRQASNYDVKLRKHKIKH